jgi:hypothetical protein
MNQDSQGKKIKGNGINAESIILEQVLKSKLFQSKIKRIHFPCYTPDIYCEYSNKRICLEIKSACGNGGQNIHTACDSIRQAAKISEHIDCFILITIGGIKQPKNEKDKPKYLEYKENGWPKKIEKEILETISFKEDHMKKSPELYSNPNLKFHYKNIGFSHIDELANYFNQLF